MRSQLADTWLERPILDYLFAGSLCGAHLWLVLGSGRGDFLAWVQPGARSDLYGFGGAVIAIVFGFSASAVAHYASSSGRRAKYLKSRFGHQLRMQWLGTLGVPGVASFACLLAMALDGAGIEAYARWIFEGAIVLSAFKFLRVLFLFQSMLVVTDEDAADQPKLPAPQVGRAWRDPEETLIR